MNDAALPAVHRVEAEVGSGTLDLFGRRECADPQFFNPKSPVIVRVERHSRVIVGVHPQHLLGDQFQCQQQFRAISQQQIDVRALELDEKIGILKIRIAVISGFHREGQAEAGICDDPAQKLLNTRSCFVN